MIDNGLYSSKVFQSTIQRCDVQKLSIQYQQEGKKFEKYAKKPGAF